MATGLLAIFGTALAGVFWAGMKASGATSARSDALGLATRELEAVRAYPYTDVGFYDDQGAPATFEGLTTVSLGSTTPTGVTPIAPVTASAPVGPNAFRVERYIVWVDAQAVTSSSTSTTYVQAYKRSTVKVLWTDRYGSHTVRQDSLVYPGNQGVYVGPRGVAASTTTTAASAPTAPVLATPTVPAAPAGQTEIDVSWSEPTTVTPVANFVVEAATDSTFMTIVKTSPTQQPTATSYQLTGLASSTTYYVRVRAVSSGGLSNASNTQSATTLTASTCSVSSLNVVGATNNLPKTYLGNGNGKAQENFSLTVHLSGTCSGTWSVSGDLSGTADPSSPYVVTGSGGVLTGTVAANGNTGWSVGTHSFTVLQNGSVTSPAVTQTFLICAYTKNQTTSANSC